MASGVPFGTADTPPVGGREAGKPDSITVGTSGSIGSRCSVATASASNFPSRRWLMPAARPVGNNWMSLASSAITACGERDTAHARYRPRWSVSAVP